MKTHCTTEFLSSFLKRTKQAVFMVLFFFLHNSFGQGNYKHYTSLDGLQHDVTYNIFQDSKGYIWIGTDDGLSKFDGEDFKNYSLREGLTSNYVTDIEEISKDKYAISTWGGGLHFLENDSIYKNPKYKDSTIKIYDIKFFKNKIYTTTASQVLVYDLQKEISVFEIHSSKHGNLKIKPRHNTIFELLNPLILKDKIYVHNKGEKKKKYKGIHEFDSDYKIQPAFSFLSKLDISTALALENDRYLFVSGASFLLTNNNEILQKFDIKGITNGERIVKILKAPNIENKYVFLVREFDGKKRVHFFDAESGEVSNVSTLIDSSIGVSDIMFDFENNLWITTFGNGVYCYYYSNPNIKNRFNGKYFTDITTDGRQVFAITSSKLFQLENETLLVTYPIEGFGKKINMIDGKPHVSALFPDQIREFKYGAYFNTIRGHFLYKSEQYEIRQSDSIFINDKMIFVGNELTVSFANESDSIVNLFTNKGKWKYNTKDDTFIKDEFFIKDFVSEKINDVLVEGKRTYIATDKGLVVKENDSIVNVFNFESGLQNERINCLYVKDSSLYLGTQGGLSLIKNNKVYNFSKTFGIQSLAINKIIELNNSLWLAGNNGISIIDIKDIKPTTSPKLVVHQNKAAFVYEVISFSNQNTINLQYKINEEDWQILSNRKGQLNFNNYSANVYKIQFRVQNNNSNWVYSSIYDFRIQSPWYKTWWIIALYVTGFSLLVIVAFYVRLRQIAKRNKLLKNEIFKRINAEHELREVRDTIARDFHDDLGNKLASISLLSDVLSKKMKSDDAVVIKTIKKDADYLYKGTKDFIFSLQEKSNYLNEIIVYLTDFAEDYLHQFGIDFEVESDVKLNIKLPFYWSKQIVYIFKEACTNSVKHAKANSTKMIFKFENRQLYIEFKDDGIGFDAEEVRCNGIGNMKARAQQINCVLSVKTVKNKGTSVVLKGILPKKGSWSIDA